MISQGSWHTHSVINGSCIDAEGSRNDSFELYNTLNIHTSHAVVPTSVHQSSFQDGPVCLSIGDGENQSVSKLHLVCHTSAKNKQTQVKNNWAVLYTFRSP